MKERYNEDITVDLREIFELLFIKKWIIICAAVFGFVFAFGYTKLCIPYQFTSSVSMYVKNATNNTSVDILEQSDMTASQQLAATCIEILQEDVVFDEIGAKLLEDYTVEELEPYFRIEQSGGEYKVSTGSIAGKISYSTVNNTELIRITATCGDPIIAADMCNYVAEIAPYILVRVVGAGAVEAVGIAKVADSPSAPSASRNAMLGFMAGLILAAGIILIRNMFDNTVKSGDIAADKFNLPLMGEIPFYELNDTDEIGGKNKIPDLLKSKKAEKEKVRKTILDINLPFAVEEAYNTMRTNMMFSLFTEKKNVFVISSPMTGDGKSTTTANLCISIGETDSRVLLVDADLRKPVQHGMFELKNKQGLSTVLAGMCSFKEAVNMNVHGNLDVLTAGPIPPNPSQMLSSERMIEFVNNVKELYDFVVIDTSPINVVSDALAIAKNTAGLILVTRQGVTTNEQVEKAISGANMLDINKLGIVVNSVDTSKNSYKRYGKYGYGYGYGKKINEDNDKA